MKEITHHKIHPLKLLRESIEGSEPFDGLRRLRRRSVKRESVRESHHHRANSPYESQANPVQGERSVPDSHTVTEDRATTDDPLGEINPSTGSTDRSPFLQLGETARKTLENLVAGSGSNGVRQALPPDHPVLAARGGDCSTVAGEVADASRKLDAAVTRLDQAISQARKLVLLKD